MKLNLYSVSDKYIKKGEERILILKRLFKKDGLAYRELDTMDTSTDIGKLEFTMAQYYQSNPDNINYERFRFYEEKLQDLNSKEGKKSWRLEADEKTRIQTETAKIARNYREQQETQTPNQPLQQQENIKE